MQHPNTVHYTQSRGRIYLYSNYMLLMSSLIAQLNARRRQPYRQSLPATSVTNALTSFF